MADDDDPAALLMKISGPSIKRPLSVGEAETSHKIQKGTI